MTPRIKAATEPSTPAELRGVRASRLIIRLVEHQGAHPGQWCRYCKPVADEIDRRMPAREGVF